MSKQHLESTVKKYYMDGLTYQDIQEKTGVSPQTISKWVITYKWNEERDLKKRLESDPEIISLELRSMWAHNLRQIKLGEDGKFPISWDEMCKASKTIQNLGPVNDPVINSITTMDNFTIFVKGQDWPPEKKSHCFEAVESFLAQVGKEAF